MRESVRTLLASLTTDDRRELLVALAREHFAAEQTAEVEILGDEGETLGYLMPPGVRAGIALGFNTKDVPPELIGPHFPVGSGIKRAQRMEAEAAAARAS